eukprot:m.9309 g.9309  ORF g.9309 m.9309 type:complete len:459 (-) comp6878_c0_seq2:1380-2756(-)
MPKGESESSLLRKKKNGKKNQANRKSARLSAADIASPSNFVHKTHINTTNLAQANFNSDGSAQLERESSSDMVASLPMLRVADPSKASLTFQLGGSINTESVADDEDVVDVRRNFRSPVGKPEARASMGTAVNAGDLETNAADEDEEFDDFGDFEDDSFLEEPCEAPPMRRRNSIADHEYGFGSDSDDDGDVPIAAIPENDDDSIQAGSPTTTQEPQSNVVDAAVTADMSSKLASTNGQSTEEQQTGTTEELKALRAAADFIANERAAAAARLAERENIVKKAMAKNKGTSLEDGILVNTAACQSMSNLPKSSRTQANGANHLTTLRRPPRAAHQESTAGSHGADVCGTKDDVQKPCSDYKEAGRHGQHVPSLEFTAELSRRITKRLPSTEIAKKDIPTTTPRRGGETSDSAADLLELTSPPRLNHMTKNRPKRLGVRKPSRTSLTPPSTPRSALSPT